MYFSCFHSSLEWVALDKCIPILDKFSFTPLREDLAAEREVMASSIAESETQKMDSEVRMVKRFV